jgi:8-oxo-dGTP diphosphatase
MKRDYPDRPIVGVGALIVEGERALVVRRATEPLKGQWSIPGGVLELGETLRAGTVREVFEETGLTVEPGEVIEVFDRIVPDAAGKTQYHYVLVDFLCQRISGEPKASSDVSEVRWIKRSEVDAFGISDATAAVIHKAFERSAR